jgi:uncharacterized protein YwbE
MNGQYKDDIKQGSRVYTIFKERSATGKRTLLQLVRGSE